MAATLKVDTIQNASSATANITLDTAGNATVGNTLAMGSSFLRNRIINGNMQVWQRSTAPTAGVLSSFTYNSVDRWSFYSGSTSATISQNTSVPTGFQYSLKLQRTAASTGTGPFYAQQIVETVNCLDLSGQTVTLSFYAKAGANFSATSNLITVQVNTGTVADQGGNSGAWTGAATALNTSQAITTTWTRYSFTGTVASNVLEIAAVFGFGPTGTAGADDSIYITGVQLEVGSVATPFERRQYGQELMLCQRYLPAWRSDGTASPISAAYIPNSTTGQFNVPFIVQPRVAPTGITVSNVTHFSIFSTAAFAATNTVLAGANLYMGILNLTISGATAGQAAYGYFNNASGYLLFTGCEL